MKFEFTRIECLTLIRCCHCRRDEIDRKVAECFVQMGETDEPPSEALVSQAICLDGERFMIDIIINRLWKAKDH